MWKINLVKLYIFFVFTILITVPTEAQTGISSPYSAFGLGYLNEANNIRCRSMGGIGIGTRDYFTVNILNPASYTIFDTTSFIFEGGVNSSITTLKTNTLKEQVSTASLSHLLFGFPVTKWWKSSFGLLPFSNVGYDAIDYTTVENVGRVKYEFEGTGGLSRVYWGNAFKPFKFLSFGVNASYIFGTIDKSQSVSFPDSSYLISVKENNSVNVGSLNFDFGVQFHKTFNKDYQLIIGAIYHPETNLGATRDYLVRSFLGEVGNIELFRDTIAYTSSEKGNVTDPMGFGIGASYARTDSWLVGFDYRFDKWSNFSSFGIKDSLTDSHKFSLGGQIIPDDASSSYLKRMDYRLGAKFTQSYLKLRGEQLNDFGITIGIGLPIRNLSVRGSRSMINFGIEAGKRGTLTNNLIQENYVNFYFGISVYERWFFKRRYE